MNKPISRFGLALFGVLLCMSSTFGQTIVEGRVSDAESGEAMPYVNVYFIGTSYGTVTDFDGKFSLQADLNVRFDSMGVAYVGYNEQHLAMNVGQKSYVEIHLLPRENELLEVVIGRSKEENPALQIIRNAQKNRSLYNIDKLQYYEYESYNRVQLAVDNISDRFKKTKIFTAMSPLFDTISVLTPDSTVPVMPVFVSETLSNYYFKKSPRRTREEIHASKVNGVGIGNDSYVSQLLGSTFQQYNFYDINLYILDKDFISPIGPMAMNYYYYQLVDSSYIDGQKCFQIQVFPKNKYDLVFNGTIWITDSTFALKQLSLEITKAANINFVERLKIQQELEEVEPGAWIPKKLRILIDVAEPTNQSVGLVGLYYNSNKNIVVEKEHPIKFYEQKVEVDQDAAYRSETYWDTARHSKISASDQKIYSMVDSLKSQPIIKNYVDVIEVLAEGYKPFGKIEIGAYYYLLGLNDLEGVRTRIGFRTNEAFSRTWYFKCYGAYGFTDQQVKYGLRAERILSRKQWTKVGLFVKKDVELIGLTDKDYGTSAMFDAFALMGTNRINRATEYRIWGERELVKGYIQRLYFTNRQIDFEPLGDFNFKYRVPSDASGATLSDNFNLGMVTLEGRLSHKELSVIRKHQRVSLGHLKAPVLIASVTKGFKFNEAKALGDFDFTRFALHLWQFNSLANLGTFEYNLKVGKVVGSLPYPVLEVMQGNGGYFSNKIFYNLMGYYEFVADEYVSFHYEHQFNGLIMNRIPLFRKWKWRSFFNGKAVYGQMSNANLKMIPSIDNDGKSVTQIGQFTNKPYVELGYGIENIFRFIRVDFIHRLTYLDNANASAFGIKANFVFRF
ncbi:MAG: hypothetical protein ACI9NN_000412 [Bacteroidia bacterium]